MISIIISILILGVLVTVHEAGHFFFARKMGVFVKEFAVGFPPRIFKKTKKGTLYSIGMIPFGGFVRLLGEDENEKNESLHGKNYQSLIWYKKIPILLGGIFANLVFAWLIMWGLFSYGMNIEGKVPLEFKKYATVEGEPSVLYIAKDSLAELSKIEKGDRILSITALSRNEEVLETVKNPDIETIKRIIKKDSENVILDLLKKSTGEKDKVIVNRGELEKHGNLLGIYIDNTYHVKIPIIKALGVSLLYTGDQFSQMFFGIAEFFKNIFL